MILRCYPFESWTELYPKYEERMAAIAAAARYWFEHSYQIPAPLFLG